MKSRNGSYRKIISKRHGFTLVELIVVIVIILVLSAVLVPQVLRYIARAQESVCAENRHTVYLESMAMYADGTQATLLDAYNALSVNEKEACPSGGTYSIVVADDGYSAKIVCSVHNDGDSSGDNESGSGDDVAEPSPEPSLDPAANFMVGDYLVTVNGRLEDNTNKTLAGGLFFYYNGDYYFTRNQSYVDTLSNITGNRDIVKINSTTPVAEDKANSGDFVIKNGQLYVKTASWGDLKLVASAALQN